MKRSAPDTDRNDDWIENSKIFPEIIAELLTGGSRVRFRAPGDSMYPTICDGDILTVMPTETGSITTGDIILYQHRSGVTAHRVMRVIKRSEANSHSAPKDSQNRSSSETLHFILRGDAAVVFDDPVTAEQILGKVTLVEREGRRINPYNRKATVLYKTRRLAARFKKFIFFERN